MKKTQLLFILLVSLISIFCITGAANAGTWTNLGNTGNAISGNSGVLALDGGPVLVDSAGNVVHHNGISWESWGKPGGYAASCVTISPSGVVYAAGGVTVDEDHPTGNQYCYYRSGSSWISIGLASDYRIASMAFSSNGSVLWVLGRYAGPYNASKYYSYQGGVWTARGEHLTNSAASKISVRPDGVAVINSGLGLLYYSGSSWVKDTGVPDINNAFENGPDNSFYVDSSGSQWAGELRGIYRYNSSSWTKIYNNTASGHGCTFGPDGTLYQTDYSGRIIKWISFDNYEVITAPSEISNLLLAISDKAIYVLNNSGQLLRYSFDNALVLTPTSDGQTGNLKLVPSFSGLKTSNAVIQMSTDGVNYSNLFTSTNGSTYTITPTTNTTYFRMVLQWHTSPTAPYNTTYSNVVAVPTIITKPAVTNTIGTVSWDPVIGRSWIKMLWPGLTSATGYRLGILDGNTYRYKDLGNITQWDSHANLVFPTSGELTLNNTVSTNIFHFDGSGLDFESSPRRLYLTTSGTTYDSDTQYYFRITAYNGWMETDSILIPIQFVNATDTTAPTGSVTVLSKDGLTRAFTTEVNVGVVSTDAQSGIHKIELSNDNVDFTAKYTAPKNADGSTGVNSYDNTLEWDLTPGTGTKTVYVRITDGAGNKATYTGSIHLSESPAPTVSMTINGGAISTASPNVNLSINALSIPFPPGQLQMRLSNDGQHWSTWELYNISKQWDINDELYGGTAVQGLKTVYIQVQDPNGAVGMGAASIQYSTSPPPEGAVTVVDGTKGTFNGEDVIFISSNRVTLSLAYAGATQMRFSLDTGGWGEWQPYANTAKISLPISNGLCTVHVQVRDANGIQQIPQQVNLYVSTSGPTIQTLKGWGNATCTSNGSVALELVATSSSGNLKYKYQVNGAGWSALCDLTSSKINVAGLGSGANVISVMVLDQAGSSAQASTTIFGI